MSSPGENTGGRVSLATIKLDLCGRQAEFTVPVPCGPSRLLDLVPAAATLASSASAMAVEQARAEGKEVSCRAGCGACCRQIVAISIVEARALAELVASMPAERRQAIVQRFEDAIRRLEQAGLLDRDEPPGQRHLKGRNLGSLEAIRADLGARYFSLGIACPFLEEESCSIHPHRPMVCRNYHVTSPAERCARLYQEPVDSILPPFHMGNILAIVAEKYAGVPRQTIPLVLSLEWSRFLDERFARTHDGEELFANMMGELASQAQAGE